MRLPGNAYGLAGAGAVALAVLTTALPGWASWSVTSAEASGLVAAAKLPSGGQPTAAATGSSVAVSWPALRIAPGTPVRGYQLFRYDAAAGTSTAAGGTCATVGAGTSCTDTAVPDGSWEYGVRAVFASWTGRVGTHSTPVSISTTPAAATVTFPAAGKKYNDARWGTGCLAPGFCGTAVAAGGSTLREVQVSVRQCSGNYWNPFTRAFTSGT